MDPPRAIHSGTPAARRRSAWRLLLVPGAVILALAMLVPANRGAPWTVVSVEGAGIAVVNHAPVPLQHLVEQSWRLQSGARVRAPEGTRIELASGTALRLEIEGRTELALPRPPGRWFGRTVVAHLESGRLRVATGPGFRGARLRVTTPDAEVAVAGAKASVLCDPAGTGVCVLEGEATTRADGGPAVGVPAGRRRFVFRDGGPPEEAEIRPEERERLAALGGAR
jgi:hypothetical protein